MLVLWVCDQTFRVYLHRP